MGFKIDFSVLNQKGTPALYTDTFANRPPFGYAGRLFIANDTSAIYEDTGTAWVLIANVSSGAGTLQQVTTNGNTTDNEVLFNQNIQIKQSEPINTFVGYTVIASDPSGIIIKSFGYLYAALFSLSSLEDNRAYQLPNASGTIALTSNLANLVPYSGANQNVALGNFNLLSSGLLLSQTTGGFAALVAGFTTLRAQSGSFAILIDNGNTGVAAQFIFNSGVSYDYTFPSATGTIALTSNLSAYLPLSGGTLTSDLRVNTNVYIGTRANGPIRNLNIYSSGNNNAVVKIDGADANGYGAQIDFVSKSTAGVSNIWTIGTGINGGTNAFEIYSGTGTPISIPLTNNVLIGSLIDDTVNKLQVNGTTATTGIKFPSTQVPSADVNVLDDYEEGTFIPNLQFGGNSVGITYFDNIGNYTKIGRQVTVTLYLALTNNGSSSGNATINNLPFINGGSNRGFAAVANIRYDNILVTDRIQLSVGVTSSQIEFYQVTNAGTETPLTNLNFNASSEMNISITYFTT